MEFIDAHCHVGSFEPVISGGDHDEAELLARHREAGIAGGVVSVLNTYDPTAANDRARTACADSKGLLLAYIYLNPLHPPAALEELERCRQYDCFRAVKLHPAFDQYYPFMEFYFPVYRRIEELRLPTLWHSGTSPTTHPLQISYVAQRFPKAPHILAHFGLSDLTWECFPAAEQAPNIFVDTTANPILPVMSDWIAKFGAERMLWGSDFPFYDVNYERDKVDRLHASDTEKSLIAGGNARRLFDF